MLLNNSSDEDREWALDVLHFLDKHKGLSDKINTPLAVQPGSAIYGDDAATQPLPTSYYVKYLLSAGSDNLLAVRSMLVQTETAENIQLTLHSFAPYTLIRNAIECASTAIWILTPPSRTTRVFRAAVMELDDAWKSHMAFKSMNLDGEETYARRIEAIQGIIAKYPGISFKQLKDGGKMTDVLAEVGKTPGLERINPLAKWQLASGMAHGKRWAGLLLNDKTPLVPDADSTYVMTGNYKHLLMFVSAAYVLLETGQALLSDRSTAHHK
ncbi:hypothetical protein ACVWY0_002557 [Arthrobacter sp. UYNi723]